MIIRNSAALIENGVAEKDRAARGVAIEVLETVFREADPALALKHALRVEGGYLHVKEDRFCLDDIENIYVIGGGKAGGGMAEALEDILGGRITKGLVNIPLGTKKGYQTEGIVLNEAGHPIPDEHGIAGSRQILEIAGEATADDLVIVLISGGGSALMTLPSEDLPLEDVQRVTAGLLRSGAVINEVNAVRKHLSQIKGGNLARACYPAKIIALIISDVVGDPLDVIASGPTVPDPTTFEDAIMVLEKYGLKQEAPAVTDHLMKGRQGTVKETVKPGEQVFKHVHNYLICSSKLVLERVLEVFSKKFDVRILTTKLEGEAREVGQMLAENMLAERHASNDMLRPRVLLAGGETTVTVRGGGKGGRNQELVLAAVELLDGVEGAAMASIGTDGVDGFTDAAGAMADGGSLRRAVDLGLSAQEYLADNDSYRFFKGLGDLIMTGPTGTNINDVVVLIAL